MSKRHPLEEAFALVVAFAIISAFVPFSSKARKPRTWPQRILYYGAAFILGAALAVWVATLVPIR